MTGAVVQSHLDVVERRGRRSVRTQRAESHRPHVLTVRGRIARFLRIGQARDLYARAQRDLIGQTQHGNIVQVRILVVVFML